MEKKAKNELFSSILYIIVGVVLAIFQSQTLGWAMTIVGAFFIISGVLDLIKQNWVGGAVSAIIGIAILVLGWLAVDIVLLVLGILMAIKGVIALIEIFKKDKKNALELVFPIGTVALGLLLAFGRGLDIIILIVGILLAVDGVLGLLGAVKAMKK
jgi:uncharacterized membrane protein HdeD (DUF308 family)